MNRCLGLLGVARSLALGLLLTALATGCSGDDVETSNELSSAGETADTETDTDTDTDGGANTTTTTTGSDPCASSCGPVLECSFEDPCDEGFVCENKSACGCEVRVCVPEE